MTADVVLRITAADPVNAIQALSGAGIELENVIFVDPLQFDVTVSKNNAPYVQALAEKRGYTCKVRNHRGIWWRIRGIFARPVLIGAMAFLVLLTAFLPTRVLFVRVEGNTHLPASEILEKAEQCGISFGARRSKVRSEKMKNALLSALPQLQWAGINTAGCVATISVTERQSTQQEQQSAFGHLVAARDGIILSATATDGTLLCKPGQAVRKGQMLISGYTDCGTHIRLTPPKGEVYAQTYRNLTVNAPDKRGEKGRICGQTKKYALIIGKKRINFYKDSGKIDTTCDKMYSYNYVELPGGFRLPVALLVIQETQYMLSDCQLTDGQLEQILQDFGREYLRSRMNSGLILQEQYDHQRQAGFGQMTAQYLCEEMIAQLRQEEIKTQYGEND